MDGTAIITGAPVFRVVPYQAWHLREMELQDHQQHLGVDLREEGWADRVDQTGPCWTALSGADPICCAGFQECWRDRAIAWAILGRRAAPHMLALTRAVRRAIEQHPAGRIEAQALVDFPPAARWAGMLGFEPEAVLRKFYRGQDYLGFVLLRDTL